MMEQIHLERFRKSYETIVPQGRRLISCLSEQLCALLEAKQITLGMPLEARVKSLESIEDKLLRKGVVLNDASELDDLIGLRLILLFRDDLKTVGEILRHSFDVSSFEDTSTRLEDTQFGYQSDHYVLRIRKEWENVPTYKGLCSLRAEVQVRTMAQHVWAAASHKLQYKQEDNIPLPLRRSINRLSALLETVDLEFERLNAERAAYIGSMDAKQDAPLDVDLIAKVLAELWPAKNLSPGDEDYDHLMSELRHFGITTTGGLRELVESYRQNILSYESETLKDLSKREVLEGRYAKMVAGGYYFTQVALTRIALRRRFGDEANLVITCMGRRETRKVMAPLPRNANTRRKNASPSKKSSS